MAIYAVVAQASDNSGKLPGAVATTFPEAHIQIADKVWLVAGNGTAKEISDKLGISDGSNGTAVVLEAASYYGRASTNIWSWIKNKWEASSNG